MDTNHVLDLLLTYRYLILFPMAFIEGPFIAIMAGFLIYSGYMHFLPAYTIIILGDVLPDNFFYFLGKYGGTTNFTKRLLEKIPLIMTHFNTLKNFWIEHGLKTMFLSKFSRGISAILMITAGLSNMSFRKFFFDSTFVTITKYGVMIGVGYFLGQSYSMANSYKYVEYIGIIISIVMIALFFVLSNYAKQKMMD